MENSAFIGKGWAFPPSFGPGGSAPHMVEGEVEVEQSLQILFTTRLRERVLHHKFGVDFERYVFQEFTPRLFGEMESMVLEAIDWYEPRIEVVRLDFIVEDRREGKVLIELEFSIKGTNTRQNMVFPFSLAEGSLYNQMVGI